VTGPAPTPGFHPARGWLNDPHGITYRPEERRYHLFFQHVPDSLTWRPDLSWGHAVSPDLERWIELPPVLAPDAEDVGCWSGCLVDGRIFYTAVAGGPAGHGLGRIRSAVPCDEAWSAWRKVDVELRPPDGLRVFRDPFVLREGTGWRMLVGAGLPDDVAAVVSFTSEDLTTWDYDGVLAERSSAERAGTWTGSAWECPQLVEVDGRWVLLVSVWHDHETRHLAYAFGTRDGGRFDAGPWRRLAEGAPYAASTFTDAHGRPAVVCWLRGHAAPEGRWAGALSVPQLLARRGDELVLEPWSG